jgi:NADPH:quinone reductase-like Zn-dependent oxidoreductase
MKAYQLQSDHSGFDALKIVDTSIPIPKDGEVLIKVHATSLNYRDLMVAQGNYSSDTLPNLVPMSDGAGEIVEVGQGVTRLSVGNRVAGIFFPNWVEGKISAEKVRTALGGSAHGMLAEYVALPQESVVLLPSHLDYAEGATLPCAAVTAWNGTIIQGHLTAGQTVLLIGTGGVSIHALQIAKNIGARVIIISSSDNKLARAQSLGADVTINYRALPSWEKNVLDATNGVGVDLAIEVGGAGTLAKSMLATKVGGRISLTGILTGASGEVNPRQATLRSLTIQGIYVGSREMFEALNCYLTINQIQPVIDKVFTFAEAVSAYKYLQKGSHLGKVVIQM